MKNIPAFKELYRWLDEKSLKIPDENLRLMFKNCFLSTLETTVETDGNDSVFIITGDIPAMWLRDSSAQVAHYIRLANVDPDVKALLRGLIKRQAECIITDPYANAFNKEPNGHGAGHVDVPKCGKMVWERKYEVDSLCSFLDLSVKYYNETSDKSVFDKNWFDAFSTVVQVFKTEQHHNEQSDYSFVRIGKNAEDSLDNGGRGGAAGYTGMTWSGFRPSDDKCQYGYLIPANLFAHKVLGDVCGIFKKEGISAPMLRAAEVLKSEIFNGIQKYGLIKHPRFGTIYAYETDGLGNYLLMDDANVPSLLGLPYLNCCRKTDEIYLNTRKFILSRENPFYFEGSAASGVGSPHTPEGYIWHIALIIQALTSDSGEEKRRIIECLKSTHAGTSVMHEAFDKNNPQNFTRPWFAWANSLFAVFMIEYFNLAG